MKVVSFFCVWYLWIGISHFDVSIVYLDEMPSDRSEFLFFQTQGSDHVDSLEYLLDQTEIFLKDYAKKEGKKRVEIFIIEKVKNEIPTESQFGKKSSIKLYFRIALNH